MPPDSAPDPLQAHWRCNLLLTAVLLCAWFLVSYVVPFFARDLGFDFFGWPFAFWVGAQGAPILYVLIIWIYGRRMERLDREFGLDEEDDA
jgi:putative solute:sodium symporter small subunit